MRIDTTRTPTAKQAAIARKQERKTKQEVRRG